MVGVYHDINAGNNLVKYSISIVLKELGCIPYIIGARHRNYNISFINRTTNLIVIKDNFSELKRDDFDILMVNSDQSWRRIGQHFLDYGFLKFAENWNIKKFVYGASLGLNYWDFTHKEEVIAKNLLKNFSGISIREQTSVDLVKTHFGIIPEVVLDPTLLIDKKYYLDLIRNYSKNKVINDNYIFVYKVIKQERLDRFILNASINLNYKIYEFVLNNENPIEDFIYYIANCKAVLTNSYHGTIFSIIFNKPFFTFSIKGNAEARFQSLATVLDLKSRIIFFNDKDPDFNLLTIPLNLNLSLIESLKSKSINFIKKNLDIKY